MSAFEKLVQRQALLEGPTHQHYLSKFYLKGFAQSERVAVFDRTTGFVASRTPKKTATLEHSYTFIDESNRQRFEIEALFSTVESKAAAPLRSAICKLSLNSADREHLAQFVAMHAIRTPAAFAESRSVLEKVEAAKLKLIVSSPDAAYNLMKESKRELTNEAELRSQAATLFKLVSGNQIGVRVPDEKARAAALKEWDSVARTMLARVWTVVHAPTGSEFITSDSPVVLSPLPGTEHLPLGFGSLHTRVIFPLSRTAGLVMDGDERRTRHANVRADQVEHFNGVVAADCYRYVIAGSADLLKKTASALNLKGTKWTPRIDVGIGVSPGRKSPAVFIKGLGKRPTALV